MKNTILIVISLVLLTGLAVGISFVPSFSYEDVDNTVEITEDIEEINDDTSEEETQTNQESAPRKKYGSSNPGISNEETVDISMRTKIVGQLVVDRYVYDVAVEVTNTGSRTAESIKIDIESLPVQGRIAFMNSNTLDSLGPGEVYVFQAKVMIPIAQITAEKPTFEVTITGENFDREVIQAPVNAMLPPQTEVSLRTKVISEQIDDTTYLYKVAVEVTNEGFVNAKGPVFNLETNQSSYEVEYIESNALEALEIDRVYVFQAIVIVKAEPSLEALEFLVKVSGENFNEESLTFVIEPVIEEEDPITPDSKYEIEEISSEEYPN